MTFFECRNGMSFKSFDSPRYAVEQILVLELEIERERDYVYSSE